LTAAVLPRTLRLTGFSEPGTSLAAGTAPRGAKRALPFGGLRS